MDNQYSADAFTSGVMPGGLTSQQEIRVLICYMLQAAGEAMPRKAVMEIIYGGGMANFFETGIAIDDLIELGNIIQHPDQTISITDTGQQIAQTLAHRIPITLRERSVKAALQLLSRIRRKNETDVEITKLDHGYNVQCTIKDVDSSLPLMNFSVKVADKFQADLIKEKFLDNPSLMYRTMIALLTGDYTLSHKGSKLTLNID